MFIDLDDFKGVNDTLGRAVGDQLLRGVASRLSRFRARRRRRRAPRRRRVRGPRPRARPTPSAAPSSSPSARLQSFALPVVAGEELINVSLSIGIATSRQPRTSAEELLRDADVAMYDAKEGGKRRFAVFAPAMRDSIVRRHGLKAELERAIEQHELVVQYQPIVDLTTGQTVAVEALSRWNHPGRWHRPSRPTLSPNHAESSATVATTCPVACTATRARLGLKLFASLPGTAKVQHWRSMAATAIHHCRSMIIHPDSSMRTIFPTEGDTKGIEYEEVVVPRAACRSRVPDPPAHRSLSRWS